MIAPSICLSSPRVAIERNAPRHIEFDAFSFEEMPLQLVAVAGRAGADLAASVHDAMPRHGVIAQRVQGVADLACVPVEAGEIGDLSVRRDAAAGNAPHDREDSLIVIIHSDCTNPCAFVKLESSLCHVHSHPVR
jgi:hypothetical protein